MLKGSDKDEDNKKSKHWIFIVWPLPPLCDVGCTAGNESLDGGRFASFEGYLAQHTRNRRVKPAVHKAHSPNLVELDDWRLECHFCRRL